MEGGGNTRVLEVSQGWTKVMEIRSGLRPWQIIVAAFGGWLVVRVEMTMGNNSREDGGDDRRVSS